MRLPKKLPAIFSQPRQTLGSDEPLAAGGLGWREVIVPRARCIHRSFDFEQVPARQRPQALELRIASWAPFHRYGSCVLWQGGRAQVWLWHLRPDEPDREGPFVRVLPESALREPPADGGDAARLLAAVEGFEGQVWREGILVGSQWWAEQPSARQWSLFRRSQGLGPEPDGTVPAALDVPLGAKPWGRRPVALATSLVRHEPLWVAAAAALLVAIAVADGAGALRWQLALGHARAQLAHVREQARPVLDARRKALATEAKIRRLAGLLSAPSQLRLLADVTRQLPGKAHITQWTYDNGTLQLVVHAQSAPDPRFYVQGLQKLPELQGVSPSGSAGSNELRLTAQVQVPGAPAPASSAAAGGGS